MLAPLALLLVVPGAEPNEAEKLFRQMDAKLMKAKAVECVMEARTQEGEKRGTVKWRALVAEENKVRMEMDGDLFGMSGRLTIVGDGTRGWLVGKGEPKEVKNYPRWMGDSVRASIARSGMMVHFLLTSEGPPDKDFKVDEKMRVTDFKLGEKEVIDKRESQVVQHTLTLKLPKEVQAEVTVWIDTMTQLPLKRVLTATVDGKKVTVTETYTKLELDGKIDPKQFELPKE
jgi:outer membrane lipoprotein-sorting protein